MVIKRERLRVPVPRAAEMHIHEELRNDFPGLIHEVKSGFWKALSLGFKDSGEAVLGEVYLTGSDSMLYYRVDPNRQFIEAGCLLDGPEGAQTFQGFCERIREAVWPSKADTRQATWGPCDDPQERLRMVREEGHTLNPGRAQLDAARALASPSRRRILGSIAGNRNTLLENLATDGTSVMEVGQEVQLLEALGLVQKDFVVFCREQGNQISRVQSYTEIEEATRRGFKCFSCGRPMAEERIDQLLSCTTEGALMTRPNHWLSLLMSQTLTELGVPVDSQVAIRGEATARVSNLFASQDGFLLMFEMREEGVRLDDVYRFLSRVRYYRPDAAFYVTTAPIPSDARMYLDSSGEHRNVTLIESLDQLEPRIRDVISRKQKERMCHVLRELEPQTRVDVEALVYEFLFGKEVAEEAAAPMQTGTATHGSETPFAPHETTRPAEEMLSSAEGAASDSRPVPAYGEATGITGVEPLPDQGAETMPPQGLELDLTPLEDVSLVMVHEEMLPDQPILEIQEVIDMGDMGDMGGISERALNDERRDQTLRRVVDDLQAHGVSGRAEAVEALLTEISHLPNHSSALVSPEGLILAEMLDGELPADQMAPLTLEIHDFVQRSLEELDLGRAVRIVIESMADRLHIRPTGSHAVLLVREARPPRELEAELAGTLPDEMLLREALLKKVLDDLMVVEGVRGAIVSSRDGLAIDYALEDESVPADVLSALLSPVLVDNEKTFKRLSLYPVRQMTIRTSTALYSLVPLDKEGVLITLIDPNTPREVWLSRLQGAANMLISVFQ